MPRLLGAQKVIAFNGTEKVIAFYVEMYYSKDSIGRVGARVWAMGPSAGGTGSCPPDETAPGASGACSTPIASRCRIAGALPLCGCSFELPVS